MGLRGLYAIQMGKRDDGELHQGPVNLTYARIGGGVGGSSVEGVFMLYKYQGFDGVRDRTR